MRPLRSIWRADDGVTVVEFAFVAPVVLLLIGSFLELGYVTFARSTLESAILVAGRASRAAECPNDNAALIQAALNDKMSVIISADDKDPVLTVSSYGTGFGNVGNPEPFSDLDNNGKFDPGESFTDVNGNGQWDEDMGKDGDYGTFGQVVRFKASYNVPSLVPFIAAQINDGQNFYTVSAVTVVRNEPFQPTTCP